MTTACVSTPPANEHHLRTNFEHLQIDEEDHFSTNNEATSFCAMKKLIDRLGWEAIEW